MDLSRWNKAIFAQVSRQIQKKRKTLSTLVLRDRGGSLGNEINTLRQEINDLLDSEEIMWQQRSKVQWMRLGDRNTKYFHSKALQRKKENAINRIMDENGNWCETIESIADVAVSYFEKLYTTSHLTRMFKVINTIPSKVSPEMNQSLIKEFSNEEVKAPLKQMHPTKAPGPDSMSAIFFQKY